MGLLDRFQRRSVEFLIQIGLSFLCEAIEAAIDLFKQTVFRQFTASSTGVLSHGPAEVFYRLWSEITVLPDQLHNPVVGRGHPLCGLTHGVFACAGSTHMNTGASRFDANDNQTIYYSIVAINNRQKIL